MLFMVLEIFRAYGVRLRRILQRGPHSNPEVHAAPLISKILHSRKLGELVGTQRKNAEHAMFGSHFERRASSTKRLHNASAKTCAEDQATPF